MSTRLGIERPGGSLSLQVSLSGMAPEDFVRLEMPPECRNLSVSQLLDRAFPAAPDEREAIAAQFDLRANPDLPDIYAVFLAVCEEWRDWRCALRVTSEDGSEVDLAKAVSQLVETKPASPFLALRLEQQYRAVNYALRHGFWASHDELLEWMRGLTALYFIDKHEVLLHSSGEMSPALQLALASLRSEGLVTGEERDASADSQPIAITNRGRRLIASLLEETESLIDDFDHYKDTAVDPLSLVPPTGEEYKYEDTVVDPLSLPPHRGRIQGGAPVEFDTGRGADLRVEAFLAEGIDPVRAVFLLRLYDGAFDHRLRDWQDAIEDEEFYEGILEPVVNRDGATPEVMELVIESGYSWLEQRREQSRRDEADRNILRRAETDLY